MDLTEGKFAAAREAMVRDQLKGRDIHDPRVLGAFLETPRHRFVPPERQEEAYADHPVPIGAAQTISQPYIVALMVQELNPRPGQRILEVGAGSGYQTAILARLAGRVYGIERIPELAEAAAARLADLDAWNVTIRLGDGSLGWPEEAPFDGIICGAGAPEVPPPWIDQLAEGGRIVMPVGSRDSQMLVTAEKIGGLTREREVCPVRFVRLLGEHGWGA
jgi:protein-L-isoaspartate(D-aspartate) O-methyltransferase